MPFCLVHKICVDVLVAWHSGRAYNLAGIVDCQRDIRNAEGTGRAHQIAQIHRGAIGIPKHCVRTSGERRQGQVVARSRSAYCLPTIVNPQSLANGVATERS